MTEKNGFETLRHRHENELNKFSTGKIWYFFGGSEADILNQMKDKEVNPEAVTSIGYGGYILTEYLPEFNSLLDLHSKEKREYTLQNIYEVVQYYCWDYELYISMSYDLDTLLTNVIGLTPAEVQSNQKEIQRAYRDYKREFEKLNL